jgi:cytochrome c-L
MAAIAALVGFFFWEQSLHAQADFYKGRTITVIAGTTPGALYDQWCASCHLADGAGRIGPNLTDATVVHPRVATDVGMFEVIYGGGSGAMQAFGNRLTQDEILKLMAFVETLKRRP